MFDNKTILLFPNQNNELILNYQINNTMIRIIVLIACFTLSLNTLVITTPLVSDFVNNTIDYYYANFGEIPYGKTLSFDVIVFDESFCGNSANLDHLQRPTYVVIKTNNNEICSFTKRALTAQSIGAKGIIIASKGASYAKGNVIESDDGNGKKVHITCLFITEESFDKLKKLNKIQIIANFPVSQQDKSTVTLFISASKRSTYVFLRQFKKDYTQLKNYITIQPIYQTTNCPYCSEQNCYLDDYCCFDYEHGQFNVGQKIIREQLHQIAIFNQRGVEKWFQYMNLFDQYCDSDWYNIDQCTKNVLKKMNMDDVYNVDPRFTLDSWRIKESLLGFDNFPEVAVNNMIYRGNFQVTDIVDTICSSLISPPKYCQTKAVQSDRVTNQTNSHVVKILLISILSLLVVIIAGVCLYRKFIRSELTKDMSSRVGEIVANYANKVTSQKKKQREKLVQTFDEQL